MEHETITAPIRDWSDSTIEFILAQVAGGKSLVSVLESNPNFPSKSIWHKWVSDDVEFSKRYVEAVQKGVARRHGH
ncbi:hypothetical protein VSR68_03310 [Paraburkholderia phymatum]|uniref:terminase small subunit-like protein n=1 Tax=Paraburkholderia phymatum TaxID=148447 RepID=UPI00318266AE